MTYLIDTNVISETVRPTPAPAVRDWMAEVRPEEAWLSVATLAEIRAGVEKRPVTKSGVDLWAWLHDVLLPGFAGRVLPIDASTAAAWGRALHRMATLGLENYAMDAALAATAQTHDLVVVTRNLKHFEPLGVACFNPWTHERN